MDKSLAESLYYREEERKAEFLNLISIILAAFGFALGLFAFYINSFLTIVVPLESLSSIRERLLFEFVFFFLAADITLIITTFYYLYRSVHNHTYAYLASPKKLQDHYVRLEKYYQQVKKTNYEIELKEKFDIFLTEQFLSAAEHNDTVNMARKKSSFHASRCCIILYLLLGLSGLPFIFVKKCYETSVRIVGFENSSTIDEFKTPQREKGKKGESKCWMMIRKTRNHQ